MLRALIVYIVCIAVSTAALLHALQPVAATPVEPAVARPVYPNVPVTVAISVEDEPDLTRTCEVPIDRLGSDTIQVPTTTERDRILEALGCDP